MSAPISHYVAYMRPRTFVPTFLLAFTGYAVSPMRPSSVAACAIDLALLFVVYSVLLWGGANAFNSAEDRDDGPVNLLPNPPPLPARLGAFGIAMTLFAVALAALRGPRPAAIVGVAVVLSIYYSWRGGPFRRGKEVAIVDNVINATGCGLMAILLGYSFTPAPFDARVLWIALAFTVGIYGGVPTAQIFQLSPKDTYATARNTTALIGARATLLAGGALFLVHLALLLLEGWPRPGVLVIGWAVLVVGATVHSWEWSRHPFDRPYERMTRQMGMLMTSQVLWSLAAFLSSSPALTASRS